MKILVIKSSSLGDIIHSYDLIVYLKKKFPSLQLEWVVESVCAPLVERHPLVDRVYKIDSKRWRKEPQSYFTQTAAYHHEYYDLIIDLQGNLKSSALLWRAKGKEKIGFGWSALPEWPNFFFTTKRYTPPKGQNIRQDYLFLVQSYFKDFSRFDEPAPFLRLSTEEEEELKRLPKGGTIIAYHSRWPNKEIPEEKLLQVIASLQKQGERQFFLLWRGEKERQKVEALRMKIGEGVELLPELSLPLLQHLLAAGKLVIAVDSLVLHLAGTTMTPTISFFGPSSAQKYAPIGERHTIYQGSCSFGQRFEKRCPYLRSCQRPTCSRH